MALMENFQQILLKKQLKKLLTAQPLMVYYSNDNVNGDTNFVNGL